MCKTWRELVRDSKAALACVQLRPKLTVQYTLELAHFAAWLSRYASLVGSISLNARFPTRRTLVLPGMKSPPLEAGVVEGDPAARQAVYTVCSNILEASLQSAVDTEEAPLTLRSYSSDPFITAQGILALPAATLTSLQLLVCYKDQHSALAAVGALTALRQLYIDGRALLHYLPATVLSTTAAMTQLTMLKMTGLSNYSDTRLLPKSWRQLELMFAQFRISPNPNR